jgi:N-acetylneuraminic acid mutarotase
VAEVGGKIYVVGGFGGERELEIYDSAADRWSRGASVPRALHHAAAVGLNDKLYVIGGFVEGWTPTDDVHEYDPASDRWRRAWRDLCVPKTSSVLIRIRETPDVRSRCFTLIQR